MSDSETKESNHGTLTKLAQTCPKYPTSSHNKGLFGPENLRATGVANRLDDVERDTKSRKIGPIFTPF